MRNIFLPVCLILAFGIVGKGQTGPITAYRISVYQAKTEILVGLPMDIPAGVVNCGQQKLTTSSTPILSPNELWWDDPADKTKDCSYKDPGMGPLGTIPTHPTNQYQIDVRAINAAGAAVAASAKTVSFINPGILPATVTNVRPRRMP